MEFRCRGHMHGIFDPDRREVEIKCDSRYCGAKPGVVVLHRFSLETGEMTTLQFKDPTHPTRKGSNGSVSNRSAVRTQGREAHADRSE